MTRILTALILLLLAVPVSAQDAPRTPADALATIEAGIKELRGLLIPPPVDCVVSDWSAWSAWAPISATVEAHTRTRTVTTAAANGGLACPALTETETRPIPPPPVPVISTAAELRKALLDCGTYQLAPGSYQGPFTASGCADVATVIRGAATTGARVLAGVTAAYRITFLAPTTNTYDPATYHPLRVTGSHITFSGVTIERGLINQATVLVGSPNATDPTAQPDDVTFDSVEVIAPSATGGKRGFELHARAVTISHSLVTGFWFQGADSQAVLGINGPGPYRLEDSQFQASGENVMFGGGSIRSAAMVPDGITLRHVLLDKPQAWRQKTGSVKNSLEFKAGKNILVEDVLIDGCWKDAQTGNAIVLTPRNQNNDSPWTVVRDIVLRRVEVRNHTDGYAVQTLYTDNNAPSLPLANLVIDHCLFRSSPSGIVFNGGIDGALVITDTTMPAITGAVMTFNGPIATSAKPTLTFQRNVLRSGIYGVNSQFAGIGTYTFTAYMGSVVNGGNVVEETIWTRWPTATGKMLKPGELAPLLDAALHYLPGSAGW